MVSAQPFPEGQWEREERERRLKYISLCSLLKPLDQAARGLIIFPLRGNNFLGLFWLYLSAIDSVICHSHDTPPVPCTRHVFAGRGEGKRRKGPGSYHMTWYLSQTTQF